MPRASSPIATPVSGRAWNAIECGTIGRFDDMLKIRGNNVWPSAIDAAVFSHREVAEYAGRVYTSARRQDRNRGPRRLHRTGGRARHSRAARVWSRPSAPAIKERTNVWMTLVVCDRNELPEFSYKARRWKDERQQGYRL